MTSHDHELTFTAQGITSTCRVHCIRPDATCTLPNRKARAS